MQTVRPLAALLAALLAPVAAAAAQDTATGARPYRFTVEGFLSNYWFDRGGDASRANLGGYGVRVLFNRSDAAKTIRSFAERASAGVSATMTTEQKGVESTQLLLGEGQVSLFPAPIARGTLDPFVGLGVGAMRVKVPGDADYRFAVAPGAGTRLAILGNSGIGLRGDVRAPIVFGEDTQVQWQATAGFYFSF